MNTLIILDRQVADYQTLLTTLTAEAGVLLLDPDQDGVRQIADYLTGKTGYAALHLVSHGSPGTLLLGSTRLNADSLDSHAEDLARIGASLTEDADLLLYGCNVAEGNAGQQFIQHLARYTGAEVAASKNATGPGGEVGLEATTGPVEAVAFDLGTLTQALAVNTAPSFGTGTGKVTTAIGSGNDYGFSVAMQADGKIVVAGESYTGNYSDFALVRYNADGSLDSSFDGDGMVTTSIGSSDDHGYSLAVQADGKILVAGTYGSGDFALVRYNADGSLDSNFDGDGKVTTAIGSGFDSGRSVAVQADGKIVVAGSSDNGSNNDFALVRYNVDGSLDSSFDGDGKVTTAIGSGNDAGRSLVVQADGKIVVAGGSLSGSNSDFALVRYNADGSLDSSFDGDGMVATAIGSGSDSGYSVAVQADGKIVVAGYSDNGSNYDFALVRYNADGSLDNGFGGNGKITTSISSNFDTGNSVAVQADGKIVVTGNEGYSGDIALVRYNADGSLDSSFDGDGKLTTDFGNSFDQGESVALQDNGKIVVVGRRIKDNNSDIALVRYNTDGSLDTSIGGSFSATSVGSVAFTENNTAVVLDGDVQIIDSELAASGNYLGANLTLTRHGGASPDDRFSGAGITAGLASGTVSVSSTDIGSYTWTTGSLVITFNSNATQTLVNQAMQSIRYANVSDKPPASVQIDWLFSDGNTGAQGTGGALTATGISTVNITAVNDTPSLTLSIPDQSVSPSLPFSFILTAGTFSDPDGEALSYDALRAGGLRLPAWLTFDPASQQFSGTPTAADVGVYEIDVIATDFAQASASDRFTLTVGARLSLATPSPVSLTDSAGDDSFAAASGTLMASQATAGSTLSFGLNGATIANGSATKAGSYGSLSVNTSTGAYTFTPDDSAIEALKTNATETFSVTVTDGTSTAEASFTVNLSGANDPTSFGGASTGSVSEDGTSTTSGTLSALDREAGDGAITAQTNSIGTYGNFSITSTGAWTYSLNNSASTVQDLNTGDTRTDTFSVTTAGGSTQNVVITVTGANEVNANVAPTLTTPSAASYTDTSDNDSFSNTTGTLAGSDVDTLSYGISGGTDNGDGTVSKTCSYGTLTVTQATGAYTFVPNDAAIEGLLTNTSEDYTVSVSDGVTSTLATFTVNITGTNDAPTLVNAVPAKTSQINNPLLTVQEGLAPVSRAFTLPVDTFADADNGDSLSYNPTLANGADLPAWLAFDGPSRTFTGTPASTAAGTLILRVTATDGSGASVNHFVTLNIVSDRDNLTGTLANDTLNGGTGADTMNGLAGDDLYLVDANGDVVIEAPAEGTDTVHASVAHALADHVDHLILLGDAAIDGTGNVLNNQIYGNSAANRLDGGLGIDILDGGAGDDIYVVDNTNDQLHEDLNRGYDRVEASVSYVLPDVQHYHVEALSLTGTGNIDATGNRLANTLTGNAGNNKLNGSLGADTLDGGLGNDSLDGGLGADSLLGAAGDDHYYVENRGDVVVEQVNEGLDTVHAVITTTLSAHVDHLTLEGTAAINGTGNDLANRLTGNDASNTLEGGAGDDTLDGGKGVDTLLGGAGNDSYFVDNAGDTVIEFPDEGLHDAVFIDFRDGAAWNYQYSYQLTDHVEDAFFAYVSLGQITRLVGNALDNRLEGNDGDNELDGGLGNDFVKGGKGRDKLLGGFGDDELDGQDDDDEIIGGAGRGNDTLKGGSGQDTLKYTSAQTAISVKLANGQVAGESSGVEIGVDAIETVEHLVGGLAGDALIGNDDNNRIDGQTGNDYLYGGLGQDTLIGGDGQDLFVFDFQAQATDRIDDFSAGELLVVRGASFATANALASGDGSTILANQIQHSSANGQTTLHIGVDAVPGADLRIVLTGSIARTTFKVSGESIQYQHLNATPVSLASSISLTDLGVPRVLKVSDFLFEDSGDLPLASITFISTPTEGRLEFSDVVDGLLKTTTVKAGMSFNRADLDAGKLAYNPEGASSEAVSVAFKAGNEFAMSLNTGTLTLGLSNRQLVFTSAATASFTEQGQGVVYTASASPANPGGVVRFSLADTADDHLFQLDANTGELRFTSAPDFEAPSDADQDNVYNLTLLVTEASNSLTASLPLVISVTNDNDTPTLATPTAASFTDTAADDRFTPYTGTLVGEGNSLSYSIDGGTDNGNGSVSKTGTYGTLTVTKVSGAYTFKPNDAAIEALRTNTTETFTVSVSNGTASAAATFTVNLIGVPENRQGSAKADSLTGTSSPDTLKGLAGNDTLNGGLGADTLIGGTGNDTYLVDNAKDTVTELAKAGTDLVQSSVNHTLKLNVENLTLTGTAKTGTGNTDANTLTGNASANTLNGLAGNDVLKGLAGNDTLIGGTGKDNLTGGAGNDVFKFSTLADSVLGNNRDVIQDFSTGDRIDLSGIDANSRVTGNQAFSFSSGAGFTNSFAKSGDLYYDTTAHILYGNTDADAQADFSILVKLVGLTALSGAALVL